VLYCCLSLCLLCSTDCVLMGRFTLTTHHLLAGDGDALHSGVSLARLRARQLPRGERSAYGRAGEQGGGWMIGRVGRRIGGLGRM
jgi:hypothetical protein